MSDTQIPADGPSEETEGPQDYVAEIGFEDLALSEPVRRALAERGYHNPTPVQARAFGPAFAGKDLIVRSKTGTGKTCAFGLPLLERISGDEKVVKALVLCPTRELALQVAAEIGDLGKYKGIKIAAIYGGASMKVQEDALEGGAQIVVGTPGRVHDLIKRKILDVSHCAHVVLDEADEMLNQGFYEEVTRILDTLPKGRQVLLFSATVPPDIQSLISRYTQDPEALLLSGDVLTVDHIQHVRYDLNDAYPKPRNLIYLLEMEEPANAIIFCNTRDDTALVTAVLNRNGFDAELLNGDLPQKERERVMAKIKRGEVTFMVATDIAARGIDISDLGHVINYSLPEDPAVYLHRVGRTGRIGKKGVAINLVSGREISTLSVLEKKYTIAFEKRQMPSPEEALKLWTERHVRELKEASAGSIYEGYLALAGALKTRPDADDLIAFMLRYFLTHQRMEKAQASGEVRHEVVHESRPREGGRDGRRERPERGERPRRDRAERPDRGERTEHAPRRSGPSDAELFKQTGGAAAPATPVSAERAERPPRERRERPERDRGERRPRRAAPEPAEGQARLWVGIGKDVTGDESGLKAALEGVGAPSGKVLVVDLRPTFAYAIVAEEDVAAFEALNGKLHGEKPLKIERARR